VFWRSEAAGVRAQGGVEAGARSGGSDALAIWIWGGRYLLHAAENIGVR
jgi:hypothetical protein